MPEWYRPATLAEALEIRAADRVIPIAGATDLYVRHRRGNGLPPAIDLPLLSIAHLDEVRGISLDGDDLVIGAAAPYADVLRHAKTPEILRRAIAELAAPALRNAGTIGGNICNASPAADAVCPLYALSASCEVRSATASRTVPIGELITGPGTTTIVDDELLVSVRMRIAGRPNAEERSFYRKVGTRRANALSKLSIAARAWVTAGGAIEDVAIALGAVAPTVVRAPEIETRLEVPRANLHAVQDAVLDAYRSRIAPIDDQRSTAEYRREVAVNLVRQFLEML